MMAVVVLFALLAAFVAPQIGSVQARKLSTRAHRIADQLELARQRTIATGVPHRLWFDLDAGHYRMEWLVSDARAEGREPVPPPPLDLRGQAPIPMAPPPLEERQYRPAPGSLGKLERIEESLRFAALETDDGRAERGEGSVEFAVDGSASYTVLVLRDDAGREVELDVLPLADAVRVVDAG